MEEHFFIVSEWNQGTWCEAPVDYNCDSSHLCTDEIVFHHPHLLDPFHHLIEEDSGEVQDGTVAIDVLVGLDFHWKLMGRQVIRTPGGPVLQALVSGFVLLSCFRGEERDQLVSCQKFASFVPSEAAIHNFWELGDMGFFNIKDMEVEETLQKFEDMVEFKDGRYELGLL